LMFDGALLSRKRGCATHSLILPQPSEAFYVAHCHILL
jgi:hypothetical protein